MTADQRLSTDRGTVNSPYPWADWWMAVALYRRQYWCQQPDGSHESPQTCGPDGRIRDRSDSVEIKPGREHYRRGGCGSPPL